MKLILLILLAVVVVNILVLVVQNNREPELGLTDGRLQPLGKKPNAVSTRAADEARRVQPWPMKADRDATRRAILAAVEQYGGGEVVADEGDYIRVRFTTPRLRFHDDAEFLLDAGEGVVHFRSASRAGHSDMGLNRQRFERLTELYGDSGV